MADNSTGGVDLLTLEAVLRHCKNWFSRPEWIYQGEYTITDGQFPDTGYLQDGQYYRIVGSVFNDGLHLYRNADGGEHDNGNQSENGPSDATVTAESGTGGAVDGLVDETFTGAIWALAIPPAVVALAKEISDWQTKFGDAVNSPFNAESFSGYSYQKSSGVTLDGGPGGWEAVFRAKLNTWRKL